MAKTKADIGHGQGRTSIEGGGAQTGAAGAGKVVWANEGFEKLAGVEAVDIVGQNIVTLFDEGGDTEDEKGGELRRNLELSTVSFFGTRRGRKRLSQTQERWVIIVNGSVPQP